MRFPAPLLAALLLCAAAPARRPPDPELEPDGDFAARLHDALASRLPAGWRVSLPEDTLGVQQVTVQVPETWRGNPVSAAMAMCPDANSPVWQTLPLLRLVMHYHGRDWPPYDCRA